MVNLSYSPSSIEQLGAYASTLRREQALRESGLIFFGFSLVALGFTVFAPVSASRTPITDHVAQFFENISRNLPHFSIVVNLFISGILLLLSLLLYLRSRLLARELREIRREFNIGSISDETRRKFSRKSEFTKIMRSVRGSFGFFAKLSSRILHFRPVEILAEFFANVLMRPIALIVGGVFALIFTAGFYLIAKYYGFTLAGSEWIVAFAAGWAFGNLGDWLSEGFAKHPDEI